MTTQELESWAEDFHRLSRAFCLLLLPQRATGSGWALSPGPAGTPAAPNGWRVRRRPRGLVDPQALERTIVVKTKWDAEAVQAELQGFVVETFGHPEEIGRLG